MKINPFVVIPAAICFGSGVAAFAAPITTYLRSGTSSFNGNAVTDVAFDDTHISVGTNDTLNYGTVENNEFRTPLGFKTSALLAVKPLFTEIPATSGTDVISVTDAKLHLYRFQGSGETVRTSLMTTDWLSGTAGTNETTVTGQYAKSTAPTVSWASGSFGTNDFSSTHYSEITWGSIYNGLQTFDVTALVQQMYATGDNFGFAITTTGTNLVAFRSSENSTANVRPVLEISYEYVAVPEPSSAMIVLGGTVLLASRRRLLVR